jgi:cytochrome c-type biogenesis protein CcmH/NrfG
VLAPVYLEQSAAHLRRALVARPSSPYTWANLALVKLRLTQLDAEFQTAFVNAWRLGPWEPEVQFTLAQVAFRAREKLDPAARDAAHGAMANAARGYPRELLALARAHGGLSTLCAAPGTNVPFLAAECRRPAPRKPG